MKKATTIAEHMKQGAFKQWADAAARYERLEEIVADLAQYLNEYVGSKQLLISDGECYFADPISLQMITLRQHIYWELPELEVKVHQLKKVLEAA